MQHVFGGCPMFIYVCMCTWMYVCMHVCMDGRCMYACMYVCMHVCMRVCRHVLNIQSRKNVGGDARS